MILLFNVKITQHGLTHYARASWLPQYSRLDIFKYCLASYTAILPLVSKTIFYVELAPEFAAQQKELETYIKQLYPDSVLHWYRNFSVQDWRNSWNEITENGDDLIWFNGNDDHIFMDYDLDVLAAGINLLRSDPNPMSVIYYSHWASQCRVSNHHNAQLTDCGNYVKYNWSNFDAIRILKTERFRHYWFDNNFACNVFRTDSIGATGYYLEAPVYTPTRELVRHYDGDSHLKSNSIANYNIDNVTPPLVIPPDFFENAIKIRIGYDNRKDNWVNLNPLSEWLYAANPSGTDYRWTMDDIPLFWKNKIVEVDIAPNYDKDRMNQARDYAFLNITKVPMYCFGITFSEAVHVPTEEWFKLHLRHGKN